MNQLPKSKIEGYELVPEKSKHTCIGCCFYDIEKQQDCVLPNQLIKDCALYDLIYQPTKPTNDELQRPELPVSE